MVVSPTHRPPLPPGNIPGTYFSYRLSQPKGHSAAGRIMSMKNSNDIIGNRTRNLPACSAMPQPTAPPAACPICTVVPSIIFDVPTVETIFNSYGLCQVHKGLPEYVGEIQ
jgi:hypothetical protein